MIVDLHTHSDSSDGSLSPDALLALAAANNVDMLSITDHDTVAGYDRIAAGSTNRVTLIPGIELSTTWAGRDIHIVGLNIDPACDTLQRGISRQQAARAERARAIAGRLMKLGIANPLESVQSLATGAGIGRPHFARHLVEIGFVKDVSSAFRKYLGTGKPAHVRSGWASLDEVVGWIRSAGGTAVIAHPAKYRLTMSKLRLLLADFIATGGQAIEVVSGSQDRDVTRRMSALAEDFALSASVGSDFHHPGTTWSSPGRFSQPPDRLPKVWDAW